MSLSFIGILNSIDTIKNSINSLTTNSGGGITLAAFHLPVLGLCCLMIYYLRQQDVEEAFGMSGEFGSISSQNLLGLNDTKQGDMKSRDKL